MYLAHYRSFENALYKLTLYLLTYCVYDVGRCNGKDAAKSQGNVGEISVNFKVCGVTMLIDWMACDSVVRLSTTM